MKIVNAKRKTVYHYADCPKQCRNSGDNLYTVLYTTVLRPPLEIYRNKFIIAASININRGPGSGYLITDKWQKKK